MVAGAEHEDVDARIVRPTPSPSRRTRWDRCAGGRPSHRVRRGWRVGAIPSAAMAAAPASTDLDPRTPVLVGRGPAQRAGRPGRRGPRADGLLAEAPGSPPPTRAGPPTACWPGSTPSPWSTSSRGATATRPPSWPAAIGADPARRWYTVAGGSYPQTLLSQAAVDIQRRPAPTRADRRGRGLAHPHRGPQGRRRPGVDEAGRRRRARLDCWATRPRWSTRTRSPGASSCRCRSTPSSRARCGPPAAADQAEHLAGLPSCGPASARWRRPTPTPGSSEACTAEEIRTVGPDNRLVG